jgi:hypothetical protein
MDNVQNCESFINNELGLARVSLYPKKLVSVLGQSKPEREAKRVQ